MNWYEEIFKWILSNDASTIIGGILTLVIFPFNIVFIKKEKDKKIGYISNSVGAVITILTLLCIFAKSQYAVVPNVYDLSGESAKIKIMDASLQYDKHDFYESDDKVVITMIPDAGTIVKKQTDVRVIMVNKNSDLALAGILGDIGKETTVDNMVLYGLNTDHLELIVNDIGAYLSTQKERNFRDIGHLKLENAKVELVEYFSNKAVMTEYSNKYGLVEFQSIEPGIYRFKASCDGYETMLSEIPFKIINEKDYKDDPGTWRLSLKKENQQFYDLDFKVKVTENNKPLMGEEFQARVIHKDYNREAYHSIILVSDERGYLSIRHYETINNITTQELEEATFTLGEDYYFEIEYDGIIFTTDSVEGDEYRIELEE